MLVKGEIEYRTDNIENALATMESAFEILGVKNKNSKQKGIKQTKTIL